MVRSSYFSAGIATEFLRVLCCLLVASGLTAATLNYPGTPDVGDFTRWAGMLLARGPLAGYPLIADYPPLGPVLLWACIGAGRAAHLPDLWSLKLAIAAFQFVASVILAARRQSLAAGALLWLLIAPFGTLLGYIDCFYLPFVLLAIFALQDEDFAIAGAWLAVALLIKWQPAILAPPMLIYAFAHAPGWRKITCIIPGAVIFAAAAYAFGPAALWRAFSGAAGDPYFSGQAFNLDWIATAWLEHAHLGGAPASAGGIAAITALAPHWYMVSKALFWAVYALLLAAFIFRRKTAETLLLALLATESVQFCLNTGVHENHAFLLMTLACAGFYAALLDGVLTGLIAILAISNILLFYGLNVIAGAIASAGTIVLSAANLMVCIVLLAMFWSASRGGRVKTGLGRI
jgi:hypothetical protein